MKFGHFDDARREYVITTPATPLPWINYLGSEDFLGMISNTGGGYCFYRDAKLDANADQRLFPPRPQYVTVFRVKIGSVNPLFDIVFVAGGVGGFQDRKSVV